jgi:hypothetical protein
MTTIVLLVTLALGLLVAPLVPEAPPLTPVHRIGWLSGGERDPYVEVFLEEMRALGYVEGQNLVLEYRGAAGQYERLPKNGPHAIRGLKPCATFFLRMPSRRPRPSALSR